jgi:hypothetical protein
MFRTCGAEQGLTAPLPAGWTEHKDKDGNIYYHHAGTRELHLSNTNKHCCM